MYAFIEKKPSSDLKRLFCFSSLLLGGGGGAYLTNMQECLSLTFVRMSDLGM